MLLEPSDVIHEYTKLKEVSGILVTIDFKKDFDTINFNFLIRTLHRFYSGPSFIQCMDTSAI